MASALLGMDPPELPVAQLVRLTGLFGISENRARVALSRMVAAGEATSDGAGRYRLAGHLAARQSRQSASRAGVTTDYDGMWWLAIVTTTGSSAEVRSARRRALAYVRMAERREGVWMRPANVAVPLPDSLAADVEMMTAVPPDAGLLADRLWDLSDWARQARQLLTALDALAPDGPAALRARIRAFGCRPPASAGRPVCSRSSCNRRTGRDPACARRTTAGTCATAPHSTLGADPAESDRGARGPGRWGAAPGLRTGAL